MPQPRTLITPGERYAKIVKTLLANPGVTELSDKTQPKKKFGSSWELRINNKIFAMLTRSRFVVKLSKERVDTIVASGEGKRFDAGRGRIMKEWLILEPTSREEWLPLAEEAMKFVASKR